MTVKIMQLLQCDSQKAGLRGLDYFLYVKGFSKKFTPSNAKFYKLSNDIRIAT